MTGTYYLNELGQTYRHCGFFKTNLDYDNGARVFKSTGCLKLRPTKQENLSAHNYTCAQLH